MLYKKITTIQELKEEFVYDRDYFSNSQYQAILNYYDMLGYDIELDVAYLCTNLTVADNEDLANMFPKAKSRKEQIKQLSHKTTILSDEEDEVFYFIY